MADSDNILDKAETLARRMLEKLGAKADSSGSQNDQTLSPRRIGEITSQLEKSVETNLRTDQKSGRRIAPNLFDVLLTYEEASHLNTKYLDLLAVELKTTIYEYINNRRYEIETAIAVTVRSDLFAKSSAIKATFGVASESAKKSESGTSKDGDAPKPTSRTILLRTDNGVEYRISLKPDGEPQYIGRGAGVALRIDDSSVSRLHCSLSLRGSGEIFISDLGSANGTSVNGRAINQGERSEIKKGDMIEAGDIRLTVADLI